jgi:hypothetical protein
VRVVAKADSESVRVHRILAENTNAMNAPTDTPKPLPERPPQGPLRGPCAGMRRKIAAAAALAAAAGAVAACGSQTVSHAGLPAAGASARAAGTAARKRAGGDPSAAGAPLAPGEPPGGGAAAAATRADITVTVASHPSGPPVPADFVGLSFEGRSLPTIASWASRGDLAALLRTLGPGTLRFGGISADQQAAWVGAGGPSSPKPRWANTAISETDLSGVAALARETGRRVLLTVNLGRYNPPAAASEAAAAKRFLGASLQGIEIGNEPDLLPRKQLRGPSWNIAEYTAQVRAYRAAIAAAAPGVAIVGPDPSTGLVGLGWVRAAAASPVLRPALLTDHYYPLSSCGSAPTASELLSANVRRAESGMLAKAVAVARAHSLGLRMDETNNISCEGRAGVSDTFAAALWALDYAARAAAAGVVGLNFHDLIDKSRAYSPLFAPSSAALAAGALRAAPEWYALLAARAFFAGRTGGAGEGTEGGGAGALSGGPSGGGGGGRPLSASVAGADAEEVSAHALRAPDGTLRVVLVDYRPSGSRPLAVRLRIPRNLVRGTVLRLTAPSPSSLFGVRLGGRAVARDGAFTEPSALPRVAVGAGAAVVAMPPESAAVVTLSPR